MCVLMGLIPTENCFVQLIDHSMVCLELVAGQHGHHWVRALFERFNERFLRPLLLKKEVWAKGEGFMVNIFP